MVLPHHTVLRPAPQTSLVPTPRVDHSELGLPFILAAAAIFVRFSYLHEILVVLTNTSLYLLYIFGVPAILLAIVNGGLSRTFRERPAQLWLAFTLWIVVAVPFSVWIGGSLNTLRGYMKVGPVVLITIASLTTNWRQCKIMMWVFAAAGCVGLLSARLFESEVGGRLSLEFGSIQNANDFASHLLLLLPFLLWVTLSPAFNLLRISALLSIGFGVNIILRTGSRGAALALIMNTIFFWWRGSARQRVVMVCLVPMAVAGLLVRLPKETLTRLQSLSFSDENAVTLEAAGSAATRQYLLYKGLQYSIEHPIFGVGPGRFSEYEGGREKMMGNHGLYLAPHNSLVQVASECGIPAALLFIAAVVSTWRMLSRTLREARQRPYCADIRIAVFCVMIAVLGFSVAAFFLSLAYTFYLPAMAGLAIAISTATKHEFQQRDALAAAMTNRGRVAPVAGQPPRPAPKLTPRRQLPGR